MDLAAKPNEYADHVTDLIRCSYSVESILYIASLQMLINTIVIFFFWLDQFEMGTWK